MSKSLTQLAKENVNLNNPIDALRVFLDKEAKYEKAEDIAKMRFVGFVLEIGFERARIITSDPYKLAVGGIPRGSYLIMTPNTFDKVPYHFTLLRVTGVSPTPLTNQVQQTYFELHKKSMPDLDVWTQSELQWGALDCDVLGMFYPDQENADKLSFSGDVNNVVSGHRYRVYAPDESLLNLIVNGVVKPEQQYEIGRLRTMECGMFSNNEDALKIPVNISIRDFKGCRTAMFGKTRLGKSNVVKLIAKGVMEATETDNSVGQIIFDINGEYANDNPQDGNKSLRSAFEDRCTVYALTPRAGTESKPLRFNFYEQPSSAIQVISSLLGAQPSLAQYIKNFMTVNLPTKEEFDDLAVNEKIRALWKVQIFWAILNKAGYKSDESSIRKLGWNVPKGASGFNPNFNQKLREAIYGNDPVPNPPSSLAELRKEMEMLQIFKKDNPQDSVLISKSSNSQYFDAEASALLEFLQPNSNSGGVRVIRPFIYYHDPEASDFASEIVSEIDSGNTVILDLGNATDEIRRYFSDYLSKKIFAHQETKFVSNNLGNHFVQLYFEEAHNLFPPNSNDLTGVYARFAKEGAKFHIGMVYSTQSPSTISRELLTQTENFFVGHLSSQEETKALSKLQTAFTGIEDDILRAKTPGYMRMLTLSHRFVIPVQTNKFEA